MATCLDCSAPLPEGSVVLDVCPACRQARIKDALLDLAWDKWCEKGEEADARQASDEWKEERAEE